MKNTDTKSFENICAIILSAGMSSRMGRFKPLLEIGGIPSIKHLIHTNKDVGIENIIVVTGYNHHELEMVIEDENVAVTYNENFVQGMFTSIQTGFKKAMSIKNFDAYLLFLVDVPLIPPSIVNDLIMKFEDGGENFIVPCFEGKKGHPLLIPAKYAEEIINHDGTNGLKDITSKYDENFIKMEMNEESVVLDMDDPQDYEEMLTYFNEPKVSKRKKNILDETDFAGRLYLIRHGNTELHKEKIFMGQVNVPLSEEGRDEIRHTAKSLVKENPLTDIIYTSPLLRAKESAEIIRNHFLLEGDNKSIIEVPQFMEMNLGDWDGRYIREIKEEYLEEYEKRGKNILTYKRYPNGENHYDLRYRVTGELKKIMNMTESEKDIVLVTHKGVINVIRENIYGLSSLCARSYNPPKGSVTLIDTKNY